MEDKAEPKEKMPNDKEIEEKPEIQTKEETIEEETEEEEEELSEEPAAEKTETKEKKKQKGKEKEEEKKVTPKRIDRGPDFKYIVRISNTDINGEKSVVYGLTSIKGVGLHIASLIVDQSGINRSTKMGDLNDSQIEKLQQIINNLSGNAPGWMLNHRKDYDTGKNFHFVGNDIATRLRDEINIMKKIRSYRGVRHEQGLKVRGQRTSSNGRKGLALGVSKKREPAAAGSSSGGDKEKGKK